VVLVLVVFGFSVPRFCSCAVALLVVVVAVAMVVVVMVVVAVPVPAAMVVVLVDDAYIGFSCFLAIVLRNFFCLNGLLALANHLLCVCACVLVCLYDLPRLPTCASLSAPSSGSPSSLSRTSRQGRGGEGTIFKRPRGQCASETRRFAVQQQEGARHSQPVHSLLQACHYRVDS